MLNSIEKLIQSTDVSNRKKPQNDIHFTRYMTVPKDVYNTMPYESIDEYHFNNGFFEVLIDQPYIHPYFDFDEIKSVEEYDSVIKWLDTLKPVFGEYSIGGCCNNDDMVEYGFKKIEIIDKWLSMHVIFYESMVTRKDMIKISHSDDVNEHVDKTVYTDVGDRQLFRHVLSDKYQNKNKVFKRAGSILNDLLPSTQIIQIRGDEDIVTEDGWSELFHCEESVKEMFPDISDDEDLTNDDLTDTSKDFVYSNAVLVDMDSDSLFELLKTIPSTHDNVTNILHTVLQTANLSESVITDAFNRWYGMKKHATRENLQGFINKRFHPKGNNKIIPEFSNKWFYNILNYIDNNDIKKKWIEENTPSMDECLSRFRIDILERFSYNDIAKNNYSYKTDNGWRIDIKRLMIDLKRTIVIIEMPKRINYIVKVGNRDSYSLGYRSKKNMRESAETIIIGTETINGKEYERNLWYYLSKSTYAKHLVKSDMQFYSKDPSVFSFFQGYDRKCVVSVDNGIIEPFLKHVKEIICDGDIECYKYILNWFGFILQNPAEKTKIAIILKGKQGCGKTWFTDILCNVIGRRYSKKDCKANDAFGKFNSAIENMKLIVVNEMPNFSGKLFDANDVKSLITDPENKIENKGKDSRYVQTAYNFIIVSNHDNPILIEESDRRYFVLNVSDKYTGKNNKEADDYWDAIYDLKENDEFLNNLFTFFMNHDISEFRQGNKGLPMTRAKQEMIEDQEPHYIKFLREHYHVLSKGMSVKCAYSAYKHYCTDQGIKCLLSEPSLRKGLRDHLVRDNRGLKRISIDGKRYNAYILTDEAKNKFRPIDDDGTLTHYEEDCMFYFTDEIFDEER